MPFTWDDNGNLLDDGLRSYSYDHANRLSGMNLDGINYSFAYNGLGDRLLQSVDGATTSNTLDLNAGLTQVLVDGTGSYLYGVSRIGQQGAEWAYYLPDALGSVRQIADGDGTISFAQAYEPYGQALEAFGTKTSSYGFAGEWLDPTELLYLRARFYEPSIGRFIQPDPFVGFATLPASQHPYQYAFNNPGLSTDPSGEFPQIIAAGALAFIFGTIGGGFVGGLTYDWAFAGKCGCDMLEWALNTNRNTYVSNMAWAGGVFATVGTLSAAAGGAVAISAGGIFISASVNDALSLDWQKWAQGGWTRCDILRFSLDALGILAGAGLIKLGAQSLRTPQLLPPRNVFNLNQMETFLTKLARQVADDIGQAGQPKLGLRLHKALENLFSSYNSPNIHAEVSYYRGAEVRYGFPGSIRVDVVIGSRAAPYAIFDFKTGVEGLDQIRINNIRSHLPNISKGIPIKGDKDSVTL